MHQLVQEFSKRHLKKNIPQLRPGDTVKVFQKIIEAGKERVQVFEGVVIKLHRKTDLNATFTVRKIAADGIGVERVFPLHSPVIVKIERLKQAKVRRAKLYYLRNLAGKKARLKEFSASHVWEEPLAEKELEKIKHDQVMLAKQKEQEKILQQQELDKKFAQAKAHGIKTTSDSGETGRESSSESSQELGAADSAAKS